MPAISFQNVSKTYAGARGAVQALSDVSFDIEPGEFFGLLGPNGAGKSTIINICAGLVKKTSGSVRVWNSDLDKDEIGVKKSIGIVPQELSFDPFFSPRQVLEMQAGFYGVHHSKRQTDEILERVGLTAQADAYARSLSGGMKRRLMIAKAMVHAPPILVLDEPTAGVDVALRQMLWANVRTLNEAGTTVILTTHYLEEAEELADTIAIINHGQIVAHAPKEQLLRHLDIKKIELTLNHGARGSARKTAETGAQHRRAQAQAMPGAACKVAGPVQVQANVDATAQGPQQRHILRPAR